MSPAGPGRAKAGGLVDQSVTEELVHGPERVPGSDQRGEARQHERHLRLVSRDARRRANRRPLVIAGVIAGAAVVLMALVALQVLIAENQFTLDHLSQQASTEQADYETLRLDVAQLEAPSRIVSVAEGRLGMQQPGSVTYLPATTVAAGAQRSAASVRPVASGRAKGATGVSASPDAAGSSGTSSARAGSGAVVNAPAGDADWPLVKRYLSGSP